MLIKVNPLKFDKENYIIQILLSLLISFILKYYYLFNYTDWFTSEMHSAIYSERIESKDYKNIIAVPYNYENYFAMNYLLKNRISININTDSIDLCSHFIFKGTLKNDKNEYFELHSINTLDKYNKTLIESEISPEKYITYHLIKCSLALLTMYFVIYISIYLITKLLEIKFYLNSKKLIKSSFLILLFINYAVFKPILNYIYFYLF